MNEDLGIVKEIRMYYGGYIYTRSRPPTGFSTYWDCVKFGTKNIKLEPLLYAHAMGKLYYKESPNQIKHTFSLNREEAEAEKIRSKLKRKAVDAYENVFSATLVRQELKGILLDILSQLSRRSLEELKEVPEINYRKTVIGEQQYIAYFDATYVNGVPARTRRRASAPRYAIHLWNQYDLPLKDRRRLTTFRQDGIIDSTC